MGVAPVTRLASDVPEARDPGRKTKSNADGCNATYIEDQGTVNYNSRERRVEITDEGVTTAFKRENPDDDGQPMFSVEGGKVNFPNGTSRDLQPVETFKLGDGTKLTIETTYPPDGGKPVSTVTITNTERNGRNHAIDRRDWNNNFGLQVGNVGGNGAWAVSTSNGKELDKSVADGVVNPKDFGRPSILESLPADRRARFDGIGKFKRPETVAPTTIPTPKLLADARAFDVSTLPIDPANPPRSQLAQQRDGRTNVAELLNLVQHDDTALFRVLDLLHRTEEIDADSGVTQEMLAGAVLENLRARQAAENPTPLRTSFSNADLYGPSGRPSSIDVVSGVGNTQLLWDAAARGEEVKNRISYDPATQTFEVLLWPTEQDIGNGRPSPSPVTVTQSQLRDYFSRLEQSQPLAGADTPVWVAVMDIAFTAAHRQPESLIAEPIVVDIGPAPPDETTGWGNLFGTE